MIKKGAVEIVPLAPQPVDTEELTRSLAQVSLKDKEITNLKEEKKALEKDNKEYQENNAKLKEGLVGKFVLQSAQHSLWDLIAVEVTKFWGELKTLEAKKDYIYSSLENSKRANEQLYSIHKEPVGKALSVIKFLKFSSEEALRAFKIQDRFQMIHTVQKNVDKDNAMEKVKEKTKALQKEIKEIYSLFKPLIEKGLPHF